jgi:hypothetical protein
MSNLDAKAQAAPALQARQLSGLRRASLGALVMLVVQCGSRTPP